MIDPSTGFCWKPAKPRDLRLLGGGADLDAGAPLLFLANAEHTRFSRVEADGVAIFKSAIYGRLVYLVATDFRVRGGSFGKRNSQRLAFAFREAAASRSPVLLVLDTLGVRLMEGRTVFQESFGLIPALLALRNRSLVVTVAAATCLGLGAVLFSLGHYRVAVADARINLTSPEVMKLFFGEQGALSQLASPSDLLTSTTLVHETAPRVDHAWARFVGLVRLRYGRNDAPPAAEAPTGDPVLSQLGGHAVEVLAAGSPIVRTYLVRRGRALFGLMLNPRSRSDNMITVAAIEKYSAALDLFGSLEIPVVSFLDTPGIDPRIAETREDLLMKLARVAGQIIRYPHGKMGVVYGRAFGGATIFVLPKVFGGDFCYAARGAKIGIMHPSIIERLLAASPRLLQEWRQQGSADWHEDMADLVASGTLDAVIDFNEIPAKIDYFLRSLRHKEELAHGPIAGGAPACHPSV